MNSHWRSTGSFSWRYYSGPRRAISFGVPEACVRSDGADPGWGNVADYEPYTFGRHCPQVKQKDFDRLVTSVKQAGAIRRGKLKPSRVTEFRPEDVRTIRIQLEMSQEEFARMIGVSVATLQNWEQGRRRPEGPARALLRVAAKNPQAVAEALAS